MWGVAGIVVHVASYIHVKIKYKNIRYSAWDSACTGWGGWGGWGATRSGSMPHVECAHVWMINGSGSTHGAVELVPFVGYEVPFAVAAVHPRPPVEAITME